MVVRRQEEYLEDIRVRRNLVAEILNFLMEVGVFRPDQGLECRHMYYSTCERVSDDRLAEFLPDDGVPEDVNIQDIDEDLPQKSLSKHAFIDWMTEGLHDCDVVRALHYAWNQDLSGGGNDTFGDFFDRLLEEYAEALADEAADVPVSDAPVALPIPWLASFVHRVCAPFSFSLPGANDEELKTVLAERIAEEIQTVQAYTRSWRSTGAFQCPVKEAVEDQTRQRLEETVFPWPRIGEEPTSERDDGRLVKAFPLEFPMGVADLRQPRLRSDFHVADAVQHLFRYATGHFLSANRGHRVVWALFNIALRESSCEKGTLVHRNAGETVLTKSELRELCGTRTDLVNRLATFGAEIPTTSMHWKREAHNLEWIVRQMSWRPPWTERDPATLAERYPRRPNATKARQCADAIPVTEPGSVSQVAAASPAGDVHGSDGSDDEASDDVAATPDETFVAPVISATNEDVDLQEVAVETEPAPHPRDVWRTKPARVIPDAYGYGRIPGFWCTLNLPYNYLFEIHRFQYAGAELTQHTDATTFTACAECLDPVTRTAASTRVGWVLNNPDIVVTLHAIRVEVVMHYVLQKVVPPEEEQPFHLSLIHISEPTRPY